MKIRTLSSIVLLGLLGSCNNEKDLNETPEKAGFFSKSWSSVKSGVKVPFEYFEERSRKADSAERAAIALYFKRMRGKYPEYSAAEQWFETAPPELLGLEGNFYKITEGTVQNGKSISRSHFVEPTNGNIYKYFFQTEERFFILELEIEGQVTCKSVRCIREGWGEQPMFDYLYDAKGNLIEEVFQVDVEPSFYEDDGKLYFEYAKDELINTILLGPSI